MTRGRGQYCPSKVWRVNTQKSIANVISGIEFWWFLKWTYMFSNGTFFKVNRTKAFIFYFICEGLVKFLDIPCIWFHLVKGKWKKANIWLGPVHQLNNRYLSLGKCIYFLLITVPNWLLNFFLCFVWVCWKLTIGI